MLRLWNVTLTIVEDWEVVAAIAVRRYEVLATSEADAELVITDYLTREYRAAVPQTKFDLREICIGPALCDMNAIRDGLYPKVRSLDE